MHPTSTRRRRREADPIAIVTSQQYASFVTDHAFRWCWFCGRDESHRPDWWNAPWALHRAHIVSSPRVEDVRVVNIMCPWCHGVEHGTLFADVRPVIRLKRRPITLANMLWIKERFDPANFAPAFMQRFSVGRLPEPEAPDAVYLAEYRARRQAPNMIEMDAEISTLLAAKEAR